MSIRSLISVGFIFFSLVSSASAQAEPNDTCATASVLAAGTYTGLMSDDYYNPPCCEATDFDYYRITVQPGERLEFTCARTTSTGQPAMLWVEMRDATAGCPGIYSGQAFIDSGTLNVANTGTTPLVMVVEIYAWLYGEGYATIHYDLGVVLALDGCPGAIDDPYEPPLGQFATPIGFGTLQNLFARYFDDDLYALWLPSGTTVLVRIDLQHALGDLDLTVYDDSGSVSSTSLTNQELVTFTRTLPVGLGPVYLRVAPKPGALTVCNHYSLTVDVLAPALGTSYCLSGVNGYGMEARILPDGSSSVSANDLRFWCQVFPGANPCLLVAGTQQVQTPFGDGWRCVGGSIVRLRSGSAFNGVAVLSPDFTTPSGMAITPGTTWNYQVFYRDLTLPGGAGFNLTNGASIPMTP